MILKIKNQPYLDLDQYLDIDKMISLKNEWEFLVSSQPANAVVMNAAGHSPDNFYHAPAIHKEKEISYFLYRQANIDRSTDSELNRHLAHFENNNDDAGLVRYLKLRYKGFDPYNILHVRTTTSSNYAADSATFTDDDWNSYQWKDFFVNDFPKLYEFVNELPFEKYGMVTVFYNDHYVPQGFHRDLNFFPFEVGDQPDTFPHRQELIWFRFELDRPFYLFDIDIENGKILEQVPIKSHSALFNHHNWHGSFDHYPNSSVTIKVEGKLTDQFRKEIGIENIQYFYK